MFDNEVSIESGDDIIEGSEEALTAFALLLDFDSDLEQDVFTAAPSGESKLFSSADKGYMMFSSVYDQAVAAASLVRPECLFQLRQRLDKLVQDQGANIPRLARGLSTLLARPRRDGWNFG